MKRHEAHHLILDALEHARCGIVLHEAALLCVVHEELRREWIDRLVQTRARADVLTEVCHELGLDPEQATPKRHAVTGLGRSLVRSIVRARRTGDAVAAQAVACDCIVLDETRGQLDWHLLAHVAEHLAGDARRLLQASSARIRAAEGGASTRSAHWARRLALEQLGLRSAEPPRAGREPAEDPQAACEPQREGIH